ncbi:MAG: DUF4231 domain-containing protein [Deltaproteobacteria bacterium]|nr:DUF4231 domain-containing protein [Deltaproteobacteria bacterium]
MSNSLSQEIQRSSYPALHEAADKTSLAAQQRYLLLSSVRLVALVGVAGAALVGPIIAWWAPVSAVILLLVAIASEVLILTLHPERQWYEGRAVAASVKTLTWKYQVGGDPFGIDVSTTEADANFLQRLDDIVAEFRTLDLKPAQANQITEEMRHIRAESLDERRSFYRKGRIEDQREWYARKSEWNHLRALRWQIGLVVLEFVAMLGAILRATNLLSIDAYGFLAAVAAAGVGWLHIKQHQGLAKAYAVASHELASINSRVDAVRNEEEWKRFVDQAEEAISREHTLWRASRSI